MTTKFEVPEDLKNGSVIEWIPNGISQPNGFLKFYGFHGDVISCQEITNGDLKNLAEFYSLVTIIASQTGLKVEIPKNISTTKKPAGPIRCLFKSVTRAAF